MRALSNTETEMKKSVAYVKKRVFHKTVELDTWFLRVVLES